MKKSYKSDTIKKAIIENLEKGNSVGGVCDNVKISRDTFYRWLKEDKKFADKVEVAKLSRVVIVEDSLYKKAVEGNVVAIIFFLCNRSPEKWKNVQRVETQHSGELEVNFGLNELSKRYTNANSKKENTDEGRNK